MEKYHNYLDEVHHLINTCESKITHARKFIGAEYLLHEFKPYFNEVLKAYNDAWEKWTWVLEETDFVAVVVELGKQGDNDLGGHMAYEKELLDERAKALHDLLKEKTKILYAEENRQIEQQKKLYYENMQAFKQELQYYKQEVAKYGYGNNNPYDHPMSYYWTEACNAWGKLTKTKHIQTEQNNVMDKEINRTEEIFNRYYEKYKNG